MATNELEQLAQYVGQILIPRINYVDLLIKQGRPYAAMMGLRSLIEVLQAETEPEKRQTSEWVNRIDQVRRIRGTGSASIYRDYDREARRNRAASELCEELNAEIWAYLHMRGYFSLALFNDMHYPGKGRTSQ